MSFQAYLDNVEKQTGKTPEEFIKLAKEKGFNAETKSGEIANWLKQDFGLGHGHAMAMVHIIKKGPKIGDKHVGSGGTHADESDTVLLDGIEKR